MLNKVSTQSIPIVTRILKSWNKTGKSRFRNNFPSPFQTHTKAQRDNDLQVVLVKLRSLTINGRQYRVVFLMISQGPSVKQQLQLMCSSETGQPGLYLSTEPQISGEPQITQSKSKRKKYTTTHYSELGRTGKQGLK